MCWKSSVSGQRPSKWPHALAWSVWEIQAEPKYLWSRFMTVFAFILFSLISHAAMPTVRNSVFYLYIDPRHHIKEYFEKWGSLFLSDLYLGAFSFTCLWSWKGHSQNCFGLTFHILSASLSYLLGILDRLLPHGCHFVASGLDLGLGRVYLAMDSIQSSTVPDHS